MSSSVTRLFPRNRRRPIVVVDDVVATAVRCWDAGFEIHVNGPGVIVVIEGLELEVIPRRARRPDARSQDRRV